MAVPLWFGELYVGASARSQVPVIFLVTAIVFIIVSLLNLISKRNFNNGYLNDLINNKQYMMKMFIFVFYLILKTQAFSGLTITIYLNVYG